jgi:hypothetical protein
MNLHHFSTTHFIAWTARSLFYYRTVTLGYKKCVWKGITGIDHSMCIKVGRYAIDYINKDYKITNSPFFKQKEQLKVI